MKDVLKGCRGERRPFSLPLRDSSLPTGPPAETDPREWPTIAFLPQAHTMHHPKNKTSQNVYLRALTQYFPIHPDKGGKSGVFLLLTCDCFVLRFFSAKIDPAGEAGKGMKIVHPL